MTPRRLIALGLLIIALVGCEPAAFDPGLPPLEPPSFPTSAPFLPTDTPPPPVEIPLEQGFGAEHGFWRVLFTAPTGSRDPSRYVGGIDLQLADAIGRVQRTLDIAAFEFNSAALTQAVLAAQARGVQVRMVTDDEHGRNDTDSSIPQFVAAGIPVVDDGRTAFMHHKFMILDSQTVWLGSWNYTVNDTYRNNNNAVALTSRRAVANFQNEFDRMFIRREFGARKTADTPFPLFAQDGVPVQVLFAPQDRLVAAIAVAAAQARQSIQFMAFSFTLDDVAGVMQQKAREGVVVQGIFETTGSGTAASELKPLFCDGLDVRQDGNPFILHHKVIIIDSQIVITGSFNFSQSARADNDEHLLIIGDANLALQYQAEFARLFARARVPTNITC